MKPNEKFNPIILLFFLFILLPNTDIQAQSYEGSMFGKIKERDVNLFIWVDMNIPKENGIIKGSYFYKTIGRSINISGEKRGNQLSLTEKDKNKNITGTFLLQDFGSTIAGIWCRSNAKDTFQVELYKTNSAFKKTAKIPKLKDLLSNDIEFYSSGMNNTSSEQGVNYSVLFARNNLMSVELNWENYSYTAHYGTIYYTYNLATKELVNLKEELTDSCKLYICSHLQEIVTSHREEYSDAEWVEGLHPYIERYDSFNTISEKYIAALQRISELFTVTSLPEKSQIYLAKEGLICYIQDYCEQYYSTGNRGMTFDCAVSIPFDKLKPFINNESTLQNLFQ